MTQRLQAGLTAAFIALLISLVARQAFAFWENYDGAMTHAEIREFGAAFWPMNLFVFGPSYALGFAALGVLAWQLGVGRGRVVTWVGAGILALGGTLFALVATAHALPFDWAANHGILDSATGTEIVTAFNDRGTPHLVPYIIGTQAVIALGALVTVVGGRVSATIPTWFLLATIALVIAFFAVPAEQGLFAVVLSFAQLAVWTLLGWFGWRTGTRDV